MFATSSSPTITSSSGSRVVVADVTGDASPRNPADTPADLLDRGHQREGEKHHPAHRKSELRPRLGIRRDAGRIVVGRPGDQPRAQRGPYPLAWRRFRRAVDRDPARQNMVDRMARTVRWEPERRIRLYFRLRIEAAGTYHSPAP